MNFSKSIKLKKKLSLLRNCKFYLFFTSSSLSPKQFDEGVKRTMNQGADNCFLILIECKLSPHLTPQRPPSTLLLSSQTVGRICDGGLGFHLDAAKTSSGNINASRPIVLTRQWSKRHVWLQPQKATNFSSTRCSLLYDCKGKEKQKTKFPFTAASRM